MYRQGNIIIRPFHSDDATSVYAAVQESRAEVAPWLPDASLARSPADVATWIAWRNDEWSQGQAYHFAIVAVDAGTLLGACGLTRINERHRFANLYYWVHSGHLRRGVASTATRLLARFGFEQLHLHRIEIVVAVQNRASIGVAEKVGAVCEGIARNRITTGETIRDAFMFSLIPGDLADWPPADHGPAIDTAASR